MSERPIPVQQPSLERPKPSDPLYQALILRTQTAWFRFVAPQIGLDPKKLVLGNILHSIVGDDHNVYAMIHDPVTNPKFITPSKNEALERLDWEITTPEMSEPEIPPAIKGKLQRFQEVASQADWVNPEEFAPVIAARRTLVREMHELIQGNDELRDAREYFDDNAVQERWRPYWGKFFETPQPPATGD